MTAIDNYDWLMIRATKDRSNTEKLLRRIWAARCWIDLDLFGHGVDEPICSRLHYITNLIGRTDLFSILKAASPGECWKIGVDPESPYWTEIMMAFASVIRHAEIAGFPVEYRTPARFRNNP